MLLCFSSQYFLFRGCSDILTGKQDQILIKSIVLQCKRIEKRKVKLKIEIEIDLEICRFGVSTNTPCLPTFYVTFAWITVPFVLFYLVISISRCTTGLNFRKKRISPIWPKLSSFCSFLPTLSSSRLRYSLYACIIYLCSLAMAIFCTEMQTLHG